jgi:hypothetical protein
LSGRENMSQETAARKKCALVRKAAGPLSDHGTASSRDLIESVQDRCTVDADGQEERVRELTAFHAGEERRILEKRKSCR